MLKKTLKRIVRKLTDWGVFESVIASRNSKIINDFTSSKVSIGVNTNIHPTVVMLTGNEGTIELMGNNRVGRGTKMNSGSEGKLKIGFGTTIQDNNYILGDVEIGKYCLTAPNVYISSGKHNFNFNPYLYIKDQDKIVLGDSELKKSHHKKVIIDDDVWIGINSVIMQGVSIGRGSVIGSNSVVTSDVPPFSVVAGAPAKIIKERLSFVAKRRISWEFEEDYPNFYKGFLLDSESLKASKLFAAHRAAASFAIYMVDDGKKLKIKLKKIIDSNVFLMYGDQQVLIDSNEFEEVVFDAHKVFYHKFYCECAGLKTDSPILLISQVVID